MTHCVHHTDAAAPLAHLHRRHLLLGLLGGHLEDGAALLLQYAPVALQLAQLLAALRLKLCHFLQLQAGTAGRRG